MFAPEKRAASAWGAAKRRPREDAAVAAAPLPYRCSECAASDLLEETTAAQCGRCAARILLKDRRAPLRVFSTD